MALISLPALDYTPETVLGETPCLECLSLSQLKQVEMYLFGVAAGYSFPTQVSTLIQDSACWTCTDERRQYIARIIALSNNLHAVLPSGVADIIDDIKCLECMSPDQIRAALTYAYIKHFNVVL